MKSPEKVIIYTIPDVSGNGRCKPYLEIVNGVDFEIIWSNKDSMNLKTYHIYEGLNVSMQKMIIEINRKEELGSDLYFRIKHRGSFKNKLICRFALNPAFVDGK